MDLRRLCNVALTASALAFIAAPTGANGEDLLQIYREAISQDAVLASARATWLATQERLPQARAGLLPAASVAANATGTAAGVNVVSGPTSHAHNVFANLNGALSASQPLYRPQNQIAVDQAVQQLDQSDVVLRNAQQDLILRVAQAYFDVLLAEDSIALVRAQKAATSELLEQAKRNFEVGTATITDTNEAQAQYDRIVASEISAQNDFDNRRAALRSIIGRLPRELQPLGPRFTTQVPDVGALDEWLERAAAGNYQVRSARKAYDIATLEIERARAARSPTVDLVASTSLGFTTGSLTSHADALSRQLVVGLQLAMPLYTGGLIDSRVREAIANQDRSRQDLENFRRAATLSAQQAYLGVTTGAAQVRAFEQALVSAETALESNRLGREVGVRTNLDVLNVESQVFQVRRDLASSRYNFLMNLLRLWAAAGELDERQLERVNVVLGS